jgi:uncharacterized damage-inducible protein DinB
MPTLTSDPLTILIRSDAWGTREILKVCRGLTRDQFHQRFEMGLGTLHDTLTHVIGAMRSWTDRLAERPVRPRLMALPGRASAPTDARERTADELMTLLDDAERDLMEACTRIVAQGRLGSLVVVEWPSQPATTANAVSPAKRYTFTRGDVLVHVTTHGYHHRAQCLNMLRQLGAPVPGVTAGLPELSAVDWQVEHESPAEIVQ